MPFRRRQTLWGVRRNLQTMSQHSPVESLSAFRDMRPITIVGGGIAGLTLGIFLRREGVPVRLWDAAGYPRHRVCGEFINGSGAELISRMIKDIGLPALPLRTVRFFGETGSTDPLPILEAGLSVSRW